MYCIDDGICGGTQLSPLLALPQAKHTSIIIPPPQSHMISMSIKEALNESSRGFIRLAEVKTCITKLQNFNDNNILL